MSAAQHDITIEQGATFTLPARFGTLLVDETGAPILDANGNQQIDEGRDFTACTARMQIRRSAAPDEVALVTVTSEDENGGITLDDDGNLVVTIPDESTDALAYKRSVYDVKVYNADGTEERLLQGCVTVDLAVTRDV